MYDDVINLITTIRDVNLENPAYGGANSAFLDRPIIYMYIYIHEQTVFCRCSFVTQIPGSVQTPRKILGV